VVRQAHGAPRLLRTSGSGKMTSRTKTLRPVALVGAMLAATICLSACGGGGSGTTNTGGAPGFTVPTNGVSAPVTAASTSSTSTTSSSTTAATDTSAGTDTSGGGAAPTGATTPAAPGTTPSGGAGAGGSTTQSSTTSGNGGAGLGTNSAFCQQNPGAC
jgi:hypothetical protein